MKDSQEFNLQQASILTKKTSVLVDSSNPEELKRVLVEIFMKMSSERFIQKKNEIAALDLKQLLDDKDIQSDRLQAQIAFLQSEFTRRQETSQKETDEKIDFLLRQLRTTEQQLRDSSSLLRWYFLFLTK